MREQHDSMTGVIMLMELVRAIFWFVVLFFWVPTIGSQLLKTVVDMVTIVVGR